MNISVIIPNFNGAGLLRKNLPQVIHSITSSKLKSGRKEIIVVDDFSSDNSVEEIKEIKFKLEKPGIELIIIQNNKNLGFASSVNKGVTQASGDVVVLLNTDVFPEEDFLLPALKHFEDKNVFAVGCLDKSIEKKEVILRGRGIGEWKRGFLIHKRGEVDKHNTLWVSGGSGFFRKSMWEKLGGFTKAYKPFYWEDIDLSYRAIKAGFKILFEPKSIVEHRHEEGAIQTKYSSFFIRSISYRNQILFVWLNITNLHMLIEHYMFLPIHLFQALLRGDLSFIFGFFQTFLLLPQILFLRRRNKKIFIKSDYEVLSNFHE